MLETVIVESSNPLTLHITDVDPSEMLVVKGISGLTSSKVGLFTGDYAGEGSYYQGRRGEKLNPILKLKMNPDYTNDFEVSDIREMLYRTFYEPQPEFDGVLVRLVDDRKPDRYFVGYTEDIDTDQFAKEQVVNISMVCMDTYLFSYNETTESDVAGWASHTINYDGSARCGIQATFKINSATSKLTFDINGNKMILDRSFTAGQIVTIDTRKGMRSIKVGSTDIMAALNSSSTWLLLDRPVNNIKAYGSAEGDGLVVMTDYTFRSQWWGI